MVEQECVCKELLSEKKIHNLKVENYVLLSRHTEDLSPGDLFCTILLCILAISS